MKDSLSPERSGRTTVRGLAKSGLVALVLLLAGCSEKKSPDSQASASGGAQKVVIKGSNTIGEELAPRLIAEYKKDHPAVTIELESKGTASGFSSLLAGECDIAGASRVVSAAELDQAQSRGIDFNVHVLGSYSVAVIVNAANSVTNLTRDQVRDLFTGVVQNWKEVGGSDAPIHLCIRNPVSGTYLGFRELAMEDKPYAASTNALTSYAAIIQAIAADQNAIGYSSFDLANKPGVKALSVRGVPPTALAVNEGRYPFSRVLRLYTNKAKESPAALDFIQFAQSARGQELVAQMGNVPRP